MNSLPTITAKQQVILRLLYSYRYLERSQVQALLGHIDKRRISAWLKDLREKHYVEWLYNANDFIEKSRPARYYLGLVGLQYLRASDEYPRVELRKRYKDASRQPDFITRSVVIASCCITLQTQRRATLHYACYPPSEYLQPNNNFDFLRELQPHLYFTKHDSGVITHYLLEVFGFSTPRYMIKKRLKDYLLFVSGSDWQQEMADSLLLLRFACLNNAELIFVKRRIRKVLHDELLDMDELNIKLTTLTKLVEHTVTGDIWEEI